MLSPPAEELPSPPPRPLLTVESDGAVRLPQAVLGDAAICVEVILRQVVDHQLHVGLVAVLLGGGLVSCAR